MNVKHLAAAALVTAILLAPLAYADYSVTMNPAATCREDKIHWQTHVNGETHEVRVYNWGSKEMMYQIQLSGTGEPYSQVDNKYFTLQPGERQEVQIHVEPHEGYDPNETYELEVKASFYITTDGSVHEAGVTSCYNIQFHGERTTPLKQETTRINQEPPEKLHITRDNPREILTINNIVITLMIITTLALLKPWKGEPQNE